MREFICAANWKMHKDPVEARSFIEKFLPYMQKVTKQNLRVVILPPAIDIPAVSEATRGSALLWGAQNCYFELKGAFTGENSPQLIQALGGRYILIGHSERRQIFGECNEWLAKKVKVTQSLGLIPMLCIGELLAEREANHTYAVVKEQLQEGLSLADFTKPLAIAYEPVWAIGTGKVATCEQVRETHAQIRQLVSELCGNAAQNIPVLYGGSVKPDNAKELAKVQDVDGFLVGGASLEPGSFAEIMLQS